MSIRTTLIRFAGLLAIAILSGCSTVQVYSEAAPGIDFSAYTTFSQAPPPQSVDRSLPGYSSITGDHIQASIAHELEAKGLTRASTGDGDLFVSFSIDGQPRHDIEWSEGGAGPFGGWAGGSTYTVNYVEGTLTIDVYDVEKKELVWHAYGQTELYGRSKGGSATMVDKAVSAILKGYPPEPESK